jgi:hypothetical protein
VPRTYRAKKNHKNAAIAVRDYLKQLRTVTRCLPRADFGDVADFEVFDHGQRSV